DDVASVFRPQSKATPGRLDAGHSLQQGAQPADLDAQPGAMRLVRTPDAEGGGNQLPAPDIVRPRSRKLPCQRKQYRSTSERPPSACRPHAATAGVDDERAGREERLGLCQPQRLAPV